MEIAQSEHGASVVLKLKGAMMGGAEASALNDALHHIIDAGKNKVVIDLEHVTFINSSGLGALIGGVTTMRNAGGDLRLASPGEKIRNLLAITKLDKVLPTYDSVGEAVTSML